MKPPRKTFFVTFFSKSFKKHKKVKPPRKTFFVTCFSKKTHRFSSSVRNDYFVTIYREKHFSSLFYKPPNNDYWRKCFKTFGETCDEKYFSGRFHFFLQLLEKHVTKNKFLLVGGFTFFFFLQLFGELCDEKCFSGRFHFFIILFRHVVFTLCHH